MLKLSKDELNVWLSNPITVKVLDNVNEKRGDLVAALARGVTVFSDMNATAIRTANVVGQIAGIDEIFNFDVEESTDD